MKLLSKVVWSEGMYLAPQHFQAQNRYFEDSLHFATSRLWNEIYGFAACEMDADALQNGIASLTYARGIFEDGLAFDIPEGNKDEKDKRLPQPRAFADLFPPSADHLTVCLAVPHWSPDGRNCELEPNANGSTRFTREMQVLHDENTGRDEKEVSVARKNFRLILESEINQNLLALPAVRIVRDGAGRFTADPTFIPPCLTVSASPRLMSLLSRLVEILETKSAMVSQDQEQAKGKFQTGLSARHVAQFWFLHAINSSLSPLRHLLLSKHSHPQELFREMSRLAGALCTFGLDTHPRSLPAYDHRNLDRCFDALDDHIRRHLEIVMPSQAITVPLRPSDRYFYEGEIRDQRCFGRSRWILGIQSPIAEADLISKAPQFLKVCSSKFIPDLVKRAMGGLSITHVPVPPSAIAAKVDSQYFTINRSGPCWEHLMQTRKIGVYAPGELPSPVMELVIILETS